MAGGTVHDTCRCMLTKLDGSMTGQTERRTAHICSELLRDIQQTIQAVGTQEDTSND